MGVGAIRAAESRASRHDSDDTHHWQHCHTEASRREPPSVNQAWKRTVGVVGRGLQMLWRLRLGWVAGHALLVVMYVGRRTGKRYRTVLYVQRYDRRTRGEATVISVWGARQWFRNITAFAAFFRSRSRCSATHPTNGS